MDSIDYIEFHNRKGSIFGPVIVTESDGEQFVVERLSLRGEWTWVPIADYDMAAWQAREDESWNDDRLGDQDDLYVDPHYDPYPHPDDFDMDRCF
jgi:hypothetical protein